MDAPGYPVMESVSRSQTHAAGLPSHRDRTISLRTYHNIPLNDMNATTSRRQDCFPAASPPLVSARYGKKISNMIQKNSESADAQRAREHAAEKLKHEVVRPPSRSRHAVRRYIPEPASSALVQGLAQTPKDGTLDAVLGRGKARASPPVRVETPPQTARPVNRSLVSSGPFEKGLDRRSTSSCIAGALSKGKGRTNNPPIPQWNAVLPPQQPSLQSTPSPPPCASTPVPRLSNLPSLGGGASPCEGPLQDYSPPPLHEECLSPVSAAASTQRSFQVPPPVMPGLSDSSACLVDALTQVQRDNY